MHLPKIDHDFEESLPNSTRIYNFTDQFVVGSGYTYSFTNYNPQNRLRNTHSLRVSFEMAGNLLYAFSKITNAKKDKDGLYNLFGINYSQFVKGDVDFSKSYVLDSRNKIAFHVGVGVGYPYGNAKMLPFERRYFSGGANSVRGWSVRSLGPGGMLADVYKRQVYMRGWNNSSVTVVYPKDKPVEYAVLGNWSNLYNDVNVSFAPGHGFSIGTKVSTEFLNRKEKVLFRLPKEDSKYYYYSNDGNIKDSVSYTHLDVYKRQVLK